MVACHDSGSRSQLLKTHYYQYCASNFLDNRVLLLLGDVAAGSLTALCRFERGTLRGGGNVMMPNRVGSPPLVTIYRP
jgi:hypothetical protein